MAYVTGTANDAEDLLSIFRTFITTNADLLDPAGDGSLPSQAWVEENYVASPGGLNSGYELYLRGPGLAASDNIHVNINLFNDTTAGSDAWSWNLWGASSYDNSLQIDAQPGVQTNVKNMPLYDQSMPYWFFANGRRFIIIAQVTASVYVNCYGGFILPYSPSLAALEYPYPLAVGGSMGQNGIRFSNTNDGDHRAFWDPANVNNDATSLAVYTPGNVWQEVTNVNTSGAGNTTITSQADLGVTIPFHWCYIYGPLTDLRIENVEPLLGGDYLLTDVQIALANTDGNARDFYGVLDGVTHISGVGQSSQNTLTVGTDTYTVMQQAFRTGQADFVAIKQ